MMSGNDTVSDTILVAQDGSPTSEAAASAAIQIAQRQNRHIRGLYMVDPALVMSAYANYQGELGDVEPPSSQDDLIARFEERGTVALQWLEARCRAEGVAVRTEMVFGGVWEFVLQEAAKVALLALGRRGHSHKTHPDQLGSNFQTIAHHTRTPLLAGGEEKRSLDRLLLAFNGSERAQGALTWASILQRTLPAEVTVVAVQEGEEASPQWVAELQAHLSQSELANYRFVSRKGQAATEILGAAREERIDLIVMGRYRHGALLEWLVGSTVDSVLRATELPVLIV